VGYVSGTKTKPIKPVNGPLVENYERYWLHGSLIIPRLSIGLIILHAIYKGSVGKI
jgi:hypothetical protein